MVDLEKLAVHMLAEHAILARDIQDAIEAHKDGQVWKEG